MYIIMVNLYTSLAPITFISFLTFASKPYKFLLTMHALHCYILTHSNTIIHICTFFMFKPQRFYLLISESIPNLPFNSLIAILSANFVCGIHAMILFSDRGVEKLRRIILQLWKTDKKNYRIAIYRNRQCSLFPFGYPCIQNFLDN
jgi:hypothetical protein